MTDILNAFSYGLPAGIIIMIYLVIVKIIDAKKEKKQGIINDNLVESFSRLNKFLEYFTKELIDKDEDKCQFAIKNSFCKLSDSIIKYCITTIINNNVEENRANIEDNIKQLVSTEYWNVYSNLILYKSNGKRVSDFLEEQWKDELVKDLTTIIFDTNKSKEVRIRNINNKIHINIDSYCVHIINKYVTYN
jgi:hypothetical protein